MGYISGKLIEPRPCVASSCVWSMPMRWPISWASTTFIVASDTEMKPLMTARPSAKRHVGARKYADPAKPSTLLLLPTPRSMSMMEPSVS